LEDGFEAVWHAPVIQLPEAQSESEVHDSPFPQSGEHDELEAMQLPVEISQSLDEHWSLLVQDPQAPAMQAPEAHWALDEQVSPSPQWGAQLLDVHLARQSAYTWGLSALAPRQSPFMSKSPPPLTQQFE
jgi:hypothetical protein